MTSIPKVVVAGYGRWAKTATNPAEQTIERLAAGASPQCELIPLVVPVRTHALAALIEETLRKHRPDVWLGVGVAPATTVIRIEAIGVNSRDFDVPDNDGVTMEGTPIIDGGAAGHFSTLPNRGIVARLREAGVPAELSYSAGTHLCNQMLYTTLHMIERDGFDTLCGFMHVPYTPEFVAQQQAEEGLQPSLPLSVMTKAAEVSIDHTLAHLESGSGPMAAAARM